MFNHVTKIKNACVALVSALLCTGAVLLCNTVSVFASSYGTDLTSPLGVNLLFYDGATVTGDSNNNFEFDVPMYVYFNGTTNGNYYSGYFAINGTELRNAVKFTDGNGNSHYPNYFTPANSNGVSFNGYERGTPVIYLDNYLASNAQSVLVGYFHFEFKMTGYTQTVAHVSRNEYAAIVGSYKCVSSNSPYGFEEAMVNAIVEAYTVTDILDILENIGINSGYLPSIFVNLQTNHNALYSLLQNVWNTNVATLNVDRDIYNTVLSIFALLNDAYGTQESEAADIADDINTGLSNLSHDIAITAPSAVADISDNYIQQIDTTYNSNIFGFLSNNWIILMLCLVFSFAILSYMLYGGS